MKRIVYTLTLVSFTVFALMVQSVPSLAQLKTQPGLQQPGLTIEPGIKTKPHVLRTHCNGTCMCTGDDCTQKWQDDTCSDTPVCSMSGSGTKTCSCSKKTVKKE